MWFGNIKERILYEDGDILVCAKPAGIAVQSAGVGAMDLESMLKNYLAAASMEKGGRLAGTQAPYLAVIHRLDQPVEGILVFGKNKKAAASLSRQMSGGNMDKYYLAVTGGTPKNNRGILEDYLKKDGRANTSSVVPVGTQGAKKARLSYEVLEQQENTLLRIHLETGRHHQIRVQMAHSEMPLLGDRKYGAQEPSAAAGKRGELALCSAELAFFHPATGKRLHFRIVPEGGAFAGFDCLRKRKEAR